MKKMALLGASGKGGPWKSMLNKIIKGSHTLIISNRLQKQYLTKLEEENIPAEYFLSFLQTNLGASHQLKRVGDGRAGKMQVRVKLHKKDVFLAQIAMASSPNKFDVCIVSSDGGVYTHNIQLQRKHNISALKPSDYVSQYC